MFRITDKVTFIGSQENISNENQMTTKGKALFVCSHALDALKRSADLKFVSSNTSNRFVIELVT